MSQAKTPLILVVVGSLLSGCGSSETSAPTAPTTVVAPAETSPPEDGITARALFDQAMAEAARWQADAELAGVSTSLAEGPTHAFWFYDVQSPSKQTCTRIRALANGQVANVGSGESCRLMKAVPRDFVDSPVAFKAAVTAGFQPGESLQFGLRYQRDQALPAPRPCWVLWSNLDGDEDQGTIRGWCIDPLNGSFVTRLSGYGRTEPAETAGGT
ncbi:MAG: hypothetical protein IT480_02545 [Gammaproteobacteria bacterium]|nr:hypothetical protein [Gammaproteobacteria bacterium]